MFFHSLNKMQKAILAGSAEYAHLANREKVFRDDVDSLFWFLLGELDCQEGCKETIMAVSRLKCSKDIIDAAIMDLLILLHEESKKEDELMKESA